MFAVRIRLVTRPSKDDWQRFHRGLERCYERLGASNIAHPTYSPEVSLICAESYENRFVGGLRLHHFGRGVDMPILSVLGDRPKFLEWLSTIGERPALEFSGFWVDFRPTSMGLGSTIFQTGVAAAANFSNSQCVAFCHEAMHKLCCSVGFMRVPEYCNYLYPSEAFRSSIYLNKVENFSNAPVEVRERMFEIRQELERQGEIHWVSDLSCTGVFSEKTGRRFAFPSTLVPVEFAA